MNPVHSSLLPFFAVLAHFHAMMKPPKRETPPLYPRAPVSQRNCASALSNEEPERTGSVRRATRELISSDDRRGPSIARHRSIRAQAARGAFLFSGVEALSCPGAAATPPTRSECSRPRELVPARERHASGETPGVLSGERLSRRERPAARNACEAERRLRRAAPVRDRRSTFLPQSTPESPAQVLTVASSSPRSLDPFPSVPQPLPASIRTRALIVRMHVLLRWHSDLLAGGFPPMSFPGQARLALA